MSVRERSGWAVPLTRLATPAVLVAAGLTLGTARPQAAEQRLVAVDTSHRSVRELMQPFAATPRTYPFATRTVAAAPPATPSSDATAAVVTLPAGSPIPPAAAAIPPIVLAAYVNAAHLTDSAEPACRVSWQMLAGIGYVESDNARSGGSANPDWDGVADPPIYGPLLDGKDGTARVRDSDHGRYDGNATWDRAVGPMQILPSTWAVFAADGNHDGIRNPQDIDDATLAASDYLCTSSRELNRPRNLIRALHSYNHSYLYVRTVLTAIAGYLSIDPAKLGINGLPKPRTLIAMSIEVPTPPDGPPVTSPPTPKPGIPNADPLPTWTPTPFPTPTPSLPTSPHR